MAGSNIGAGAFAANPPQAGDHAGQDVTANSYSASSASGNDAFKAVTNGARFHVGAGASDYFSSDGTTITFAGPIASSNTVTGSIILSSYIHPPGTNSMDVGGNIANGAAAIGARFSNISTLSTAGAAVAAFYPDNFTTKVAAIQATGAFNPDFTDDSATTGNRTVNKPAGINAIAAGAAAITITNSVVKATSIVLCVLQTADATLTFIKSVVPAAGSFIVTGNANATATTKVGWIVFNGN